MRDEALKTLMKGRVAEALVESIFRHARYYVARAGRESSVIRLPREDSDDLPDCLVWRPAENLGLDLHQLFMVEVKYRSDLADFFRFGGAEKLANAKQRWPDLYFVFVTDHPAADRSCFQAMCLRDYTPGEEPNLVDLHQLPALGIYPRTVAEHGALAQDLFAPLGSQQPSRRDAIAARRKVADRHPGS